MIGNMLAFVPCWMLVGCAIIGKDVLHQIDLLISEYARSSPHFRLHRALAK